MRYISAHYIFPVSSPPIRNGILGLHNDGTIAEVIDPGGEVRETAGLEFYSGVLVPGFVNTHCHLELSHLRGALAPATGMANFVSQVSHTRNQYSHKTIDVAAQWADSYMYATGTSAVVDIANTTICCKLIAESQIDYIPMLEIFGMDPEKYELILHKAISSLRLNSLCIPYTITPHAPYSASVPLLRAISNTLPANRFISVHFKESNDEVLLFADKETPLREYLQTYFRDIDKAIAGFDNPASYLLSGIPCETPLLLVHACHLTEYDIDTISQWGGKAAWSVCPNSNLYIGNPLPPIDLMVQSGYPITLGTDSLASNSFLNMVEEMKTLHRYFPHIPFGDMLQWATLNGATWLGKENTLGTLEVGKKPGIVLLESFDFETLSVGPDTRARRLN